jgi:hypothetical protein
MRNEIIISPKGMKYVHAFTKDRMIEIHLGKQIIHTSLSVGVFLFPSVVSSLTLDPTADRFTLCSPNVRNYDSNKVHDLLSEIVLCFEDFRPLDASSFEFETIACCAGLVGNDELSRRLFEGSGHSADETDCVLSLRALRTASAVSYCSSHFTSLRSVLVAEEVSFVNAIVFDSGLVVESEDSLLSFCTEHFDLHGDASIFGCVLFHRVSPLSMNEFISHLSFESLSPAWPSLCARICLPVDASSDAFNSLPSHSHSSDPSTPVEHFDSLADLFRSHSDSLRLRASSSGNLDSSRLPEYPLEKGLSKY